MGNKKKHQAIQKQLEEVHLSPTQTTEVRVDGKQVFDVTAELQEFYMDMQDDHYIPGIPEIMDDLYYLHDRFLLFESLRIDSDQDAMDDFHMKFKAMGISTQILTDAERVIYNVAVIDEEDYQLLLKEAIAEGVLKVEKKGRKYVEPDILPLYEYRGDTVYLNEFVRWNPVKQSRNRKTLPQLEVELKDALKKEDYGKAAQLRDRIDKMKKGKKK